MPEGGNNTEGAEPGNIHGMNGSAVPKNPGDASPAGLMLCWNSAANCGKANLDSSDIASPSPLTEEVGEVGEELKILCDIR